MNIEQYEALMAQRRAQRVTAVTTLTERIREKADVASQAILDLHAPTGAAKDQCAGCFDMENAGEPAYWPCDTINAMATAYGIAPPQELC